MIKLYEFFDTDFYAAKNLRDAVRECVSNSECSIREALEECRILTDADMERYIFVDDVYDHNSSTKRTFKKQLESEILKNTKFPAAFASREY